MNTSVVFIQQEPYEEYKENRPPKTELSSGGQAPCSTGFPC